MLYDFINSWFYGAYFDRNSRNLKGSVLRILTENRDENTKRKGPRMRPFMLQTWKMAIYIRLRTMNMNVFNHYSGVFAMPYINESVKEKIYTELNNIIEISYNDEEVEEYYRYIKILLNQKDASNRTTREIAIDLEIKTTNQIAKWKAIKRRRAYFAKVRAQQTLKLLANSHDYICSHPECSINEDLTIDHIIPISKGGGDEIENLQFMCRSHNSSKCDR